MERLDERAARAATSLRAMVAAGLDGDDVPRLEEARPRRGWTVPAAIAAALLLVAGAAAVLVTGGEQSEPIVAGPAEEAAPLPRLIADPVPEGMEVLGVMDLPYPRVDEEAAVSTMSVYGAPDAEDPFAEADLGVAVTVLASASPGVESDYGDPVTVRGRPGRLSPLEDHSPTTVQWQETDSVFVDISSHSLPREELLAVAEALDLSDPLRAPGETLPGGLALVASASPGFPWMATEGSMLSYTGGDIELTVMTMRGSPEVLSIVQWQQRKMFEPTTVRGRDGRRWADSDPMGDDWSGLFWVERDDVVVMLQSRNLGADRVAEIAESLRPATDAEWEELLRTSGIQRMDEPPPGALVVGERGDVTWWLALEDHGPEPSLCLTIAHEGGGGSSCMGYSGPDGSLLADQVFDYASDLELGSAGGDGAVIFGRVAAEVAQIELHGDGHPSQRVELHDVDGVEGRFYATWWPAEEGEVRLVAFGADGTELGQETVRLLPAPQPPGPDGPPAVTGELRLDGPGDAVQPDAPTSVEAEAIEPTTTSTTPTGG